MFGYKAYSLELRGLNYPKLNIYRAHTHIKLFEDPVPWAILLSTDGWLHVRIDRL